MHVRRMNYDSSNFMNNVLGIFQFITLLKGTWQRGGFSEVFAEIGSA
jgi:hypothetical protein